MGLKEAYGVKHKDEQDPKMKLKDHLFFTLNQMEYLFQNWHN